mgnify:CR=1 FL=1
MNSGTEPYVNTSIDDNREAFSFLNEAIAENDTIAEMCSSENEQASNNII